MTPLKPIENLRVKGVAAERYPLNTICAHPECTEPVADPHHIWPRSQIVGDSWFVSITIDARNCEKNPFADPKLYGIEFVRLVGMDTATAVIPHVTGLCRQHHEAVEEHWAWIKLEDGIFNWYRRTVVEGFYGPDKYELVGQLNPQPGSREGKPKKAKRKPAEPGRPKAVYAVRVPKDELEDGHSVLTELVEQVRDKLGPELGWTDTVGAYFVLVAALVKALQA